MADVEQVPTSAVISVFGSSRAADGDEAYEQARALGAALAQAGFVVASGGYGGTMEAVSRGAAEAGGRVIGVVAKAISTTANPWVHEINVVPQWEDRLLQLIRLGDGYVALPGGTGTLVELAVVWEMIHKRVMPPRPVVTLGGFWSPLIAHVEAADTNSRGLIRLADNIPAAVSLLRASL
jgi:uncharacterized protein (TIGR00730 family)